MFHEESLVTTVFKILNLGVFIAAAGYLFKKQLIPIRQEIAQKKLDQTTLVQENKLSDQELAHVQRSVDEQKKWLETMEHNIVQWNARMLAIHKQFEQEKDEIRKKVAHKVAQQALYVQMTQARYKVIPLAVDQARHKLEKMDMQQKQAYVKNLLRFFKEDIK